MSVSELFIDFVRGIKLSKIGDRYNRLFGRAVEFSIDPQSFYATDKTYKVKR